MSAMWETERVCVVAAMSGAGVGCGPLGGTCTHAEKGYKRAQDRRCCLAKWKIHDLLAPSYTHTLHQQALPLRSVSLELARYLLYRTGLEFQKNPNQKYGLLEFFQAHMVLLGSICLHRHNHPRLVPL